MSNVQKSNDSFYDFAEYETNKTAFVCHSELSSQFWTTGNIYFLNFYKFKNKMSVFQHFTPFGNPNYVKVSLV